MKNATLLAVIKIVAAPLGFFGALSLMRSVSISFNWYASRVYGDWFNFGLGLSIFWLTACLGMFAYSIERTSNPRLHLPYRKFDYSLLALLCSVGFYACAQMLQGLPPAILGWTIESPNLHTTMILFPIIAYLLVIFAFGELVARLRDKTLIPTLYWFAFFKAYPIWQTIGFFAVLMLTSQLYLLVYYFSTPIRILSLFVICSLTYFAAFLQNLSRQYDNANTEKIRAERFKSELITNVSHDIRTPLTSIINYVDLLKKENVQGKAGDYVQVLDRKSARLKTLIDDLMEASKAGTGNLLVDMQEINLGELVGQVAGEFEDSFAQRELTLVLRQPPNEPIFANTDSRHLYRTLENLFSNAVKYAQSGTRVFAEIALREGKPYFVLQNTSENPVGLADGEATEQFLRGDKARQTEGSGLGLYIAKSLVELMGGKLQVSIIGDLFRVEIFP